MTAPFTIGTPKNMTTRARQTKSNPIKLASPAEITGTNAETESDSLKVPPPNEMFMLNTRCEKSIMDEVQFYFKDYQDFITSNNQKLIAVLKGVGLFPPKGKNLDKSANPNLIPINTDEFNEHLGKPQIEQSVEEVNKDLNERGLYQPPNNPNDNSRGRPRSPESIE